MPNRVLSLTTFVLLAAFVGLSPTAAAGPEHLTNTGLAHGPVQGAKTPFYLFHVYESRQGQDLNGDGDELDRVRHVYRVADGSITNLSFTFASGLLGRSRPDSFVFVVLESELGLDVNGDGDLGDNVLHVLDFTTGTVTARDVAFNGAWLFGETLLFEDNSSRMLSKYDLATGYSEVVGPSPTEVALMDGFVVLSLWEQRFGIDLNGDGDVIDAIAHVFDFNAGTLMNLGLATRSIKAANRSAAIVVDESSQSEDLNGDGDELDKVVHYLHASSGSNINGLRDGKGPRLKLRNTALAIGPYFPLHRVALSNHWLALGVDENRHGRDANGDGDLDDEVLAVVDMRGNRVRNTGNVLDIGIDPARLQVGGALVGFRGEAGTTTPGDLYLYDARRKTTRATATFVGRYLSFWVQHDYAYFRRSEHRWGDLNGDGDARDRVPTVFERRTSTSTSLGIAAPLRFNATSDWLVVRVSEWDQGQDLNADGDLNGYVPFVYNVRSRQLTSLQVEISGLQALAKGVFAVGVSEGLTRYSGVDLNGDGDTRDSVLHILQVGKERSR